MQNAPYIYAATAVQVIDGDTVDLDVDLGFQITARMRFRLYGINTPERGQEGYTQATEYLRHLIFYDPYTAPRPVPLTIATRKDRGDKYGRMLVTIYRPGTDVSVNDQMVHSGHAVAYDGGAR